MTKKKMVLTISLVALVAVAILAIALVITFNAHGVALADNKITSGGGNSAQTTVTYSVGNTWEVTIPDGIIIGGDGTGTGTVSASGVKIEKDTNLEVSVHSQNEWTVKNTEEDKQLSYELKKGGTKVEQDGTVLSVAAGTDSGEQELTAELTADSKKYSAGEDSYTDELTFTVEVKDKAA